MVSSVPPGMNLPPPGLCLPSAEQMSMNSGAPFFHMGFPSMNHQMQPWAGQVMMGNQYMYTGDSMTFSQSPLVSRKSSPSQSRSPSRSNSPQSRRNGTLPRTSSQATQSTITTMATSTISFNSQTSSVSSSVSSSMPSLPTVGVNRTLPGQPPLLTSRSIPPSIVSTAASYARQNNMDVTSLTTASTAQQQPPPPRLRPSTDLLREGTGKEVPVFNKSGNYEEVYKYKEN